MKLYYSPGACSLAVHAILRELGEVPTLVKVDLAAKRTADGADYLAINPKGYVPALQLDNGEMLTEAGVILQYIADQHPQSGLFPELGSMARYHAMEWLNFISTEVHKGIGAFWNPALPEDYKKLATGIISRRLNLLAERLGKQDYVLERFSILDAYLFNVLNWCQFVKFDLGPWPALQAFHQRIAARPAVQAALKAEFG